LAASAMDAPVAAFIGWDSDSGDSYVLLAVWCRLPVSCHRRR
jgi:hypothetical protein